MHQVDEDENDDGWLGCSCPSCHQLFRVPSTSAGKQAECPNCAGVVDIPLTERRVKNDFRHMNEVKQTAEGGADGTGRRRIRHHAPAKPPEPVEDLTWDQAPSAVRKRVHRKRGVRVLVGLSALAALGVGVFLWSRTLKEVQPETPEVTEDRPLNLPSPVEQEEPGNETQILTGPLAEIDLEAVLAEVRPVVTRFLQAETLEEMLALVRGGEREREKIRRYYESVIYVADPPLQVAPNGVLRTTGSVLALQVVLQNQSRKSIAVEKVGDRYLVDWESWVGYSDLTWEEFLKTQPHGPKLFRVLCSKVEYYNFEFSDDRKWRSYRLQSPDKRHTIYGYVRRYSPQEEGLSTVDKQRPDSLAPYVVKLRYPKGEGRKDQVLIDEVRTSGWVLDVATPETAGR